MADPKAIFDEDDSACDNPNLLDSQPACLKCGQTQRIMKCCTRCQSSFYCSRSCFVKHWPIHKHSCLPNKQLRENASQHAEDTADPEKTLYKVVAHKKLPAVPLCVGFQKAADALRKDTTALRVSHPEKEEKEDNIDDDGAGVEVILRYSKDKHKFKVGDNWDGSTILRKIATFTSCLPEKMRVISKGKQLDATTVRSAVRGGAVFQVLGEKMEDAQGLVVRDIEVLMQQMGVERNVAVRALRKCDGDLIDALMDIGNK